MVFTSKFPASPPVSEYHDDDAVRTLSTEDAGATQVVTSTITSAKTEIGSTSQNDDAWLWPIDHDFNFEDDFTYEINITLAAAWQ